ncbi:MAG: histidine--tRNA ligase [Oscillospiraceae bacterium]|nr:histidine--tRNA ligase [Oscillospiraceae bacterium]
MPLLTQSPRGTQDVLPQDSYKWQYVENKMRDICSTFGYGELRTPTFEHTELFARGVGDSTDVVDKEMYTFEDRGLRSITLRPEGTAGAVRALIQAGAFAGTLPVRAYYLTSCFRYEKPQSGRLREFHQLGIELFGVAGPDADFETISVADRILKGFGLKNVELNINSIGCPKCRSKYRASLIDYFNGYYDDLCPTCKERLNKNPMRILDCKEEKCSNIAKGAPLMIDYLCEECSDHFESVQNMLTEADIPFTVNPRIVRGLDYYTRTVFEFVYNGRKGLGTVCGGGRYDGLVSLLGGPETPAIGFGLGIERLISTIENEGIEIPKPDGPSLFICCAEDRAYPVARKLVEQLRDSGVKAMYDINRRSLKAQMKFANKVGSVYTAVLGGNELDSNTVTLHNMADKSDTALPLDADAIIGFYK